MTQDHRSKAKAAVAKEAQDKELQRQRVEGKTTASQGASLQGIIRGASPQEMARRLGIPPVIPAIDTSQFRYLQRLGSGASSRVLLAETPDREEIAVKKFHIVLQEKDKSRRLDFSMGQVDEERFVREVISARIAGSHPNMPTVHGVGFAGSEIESEYHPQLVMQAITGDTLDQRIQKHPLSAQEIRDLALELSKPLGFLHEREIFHRDIKPVNIRYDQDATLYLLDMGLAREREGVTLHGTMEAGTHWFAHPYQLGGAPSFQTDLFSLGRTLYYSATGQTTSDLTLHKSALLLALPRDEQLRELILQLGDFDLSSGPQTVKKLQSSLMGRDVIELSSQRSYSRAEEELGGGISTSEHERQAAVEEIHEALGYTDGYDPVLDADIEQRAADATQGAATQGSNNLGTIATIALGTWDERDAAMKRLEESGFGKNLQDSTIPSDKNDLIDQKIRERYFLHRPTKTNAQATTVLKAYGFYKATTAFEDIPAWALFASELFKVTTEAPMKHKQEFLAELLLDNVNHVTAATQYLEEITRSRIEEDLIGVGLESAILEELQIFESKDQGADTSLESKVQGSQGVVGKKLWEVDSNFGRRLRKIETQSLVKHLPLVFGAMPLGILTGNTLGLDEWGTVKYGIGFMVASFLANSPQFLREYSATSQAVSLPAQAQFGEHFDLDVFTKYFSQLTEKYQNKTRGAIRKYPRQHIQDIEYIDGHIEHGLEVISEASLQVKTWGKTTDICVVKGVEGSGEYQLVVGELEKGVDGERYPIDSRQRLEEMTRDFPALKKLRTKDPAVYHSLWAVLPEGEEKKQEIAGMTKQRTQNDFETRGKSPALNDVLEEIHEDGRITAAVLEQASIEGTRQRIAASKKRMNLLEQRVSRDESDDLFWYLNDSKNPQRTYKKALQLLLDEEREHGPLGELPRVFYDLVQEEETYLNLLARHPQLKTLHQEKHQLERERTLYFSDGGEYLLCAASSTFAITSPWIMPDLANMIGAFSVGAMGAAVSALSLKKKHQQKQKHRKIIGQLTDLEQTIDFHTNYAVPIEVQIGESFNSDAAHAFLEQFPTGEEHSTYSISLHREKMSGEKEPVIFVGTKKRYFGKVLYQDLFEDTAEIHIEPDKIFINGSDRWASAEIKNKRDLENYLATEQGRYKDNPIKAIKEYKPTLYCALEAMLPEVEYTEDLLKAAEHLLTSEDRIELQEIDLTPTEVRKKLRIHKRLRDLLDKPGLLSPLRAPRRYTSKELRETLDAAGVYVTLGAITGKPLPLRTHKDIFERGFYLNLPNAFEILETDLGADTVYQIYSTDCEEYKK